MIILIPSYEPGAHLVPLVHSLRELRPGVEVLVVDDGSGPEYAHVFEAAHRAGATILPHSHNRGKGAALKTGFAHLAAVHPDEDVVTADADGQHTPGDIVRIGDELRTDAEDGVPALILGARDLRGDVPARSRFGNAVGRGLFRVAAGWYASDTQTGLRGIPASMRDWVSTVPGERFDYEIEMLLRVRRAGLTVREVPIETVYLEHNASSHFRPLVDSVRVILPMLTFAASSLLAFLVDSVALLVFTALLPAGAGWLVASIVVSRLLSATVNFAVNRRFVFSAAPGRAHAHALRYVLLASLLLLSNIMWMQALTSFGMTLPVAKVVTEAALFLLSYQVQRHVVFEDFSAPKDRLRKREGAGGRMEAHAPHLERASR
ncbi:MAG: bifunctional glycosyltransferase family 2/GtrA family protein [Microbacterium sp.]